MKILVTGSAGFIGSNLVLRLLDGKEPVKIVGLDNLNNYYDPSLKDYRLGVIEGKAKEHPEHQYQFVKGDLGYGHIAENPCSLRRNDKIVHKNQKINGFYDGYSACNSWLAEISPCIR